MIQMQCSIHYFAENIHPIEKRFRKLSADLKANENHYSFMNQKIQEIVLIKRQNSISLYAPLQCDHRWIDEKVNSFKGIRMVCFSDYSPFQRPEYGNLWISLYQNNHMLFDSLLKNNGNNFFMKPSAYFDARTLSHYLSGNFSADELQKAWDIGDPEKTTLELEKILRLPLRMPSDLDDNYVLEEKLFKLSVFAPKNKENCNIKLNNSFSAKMIEPSNRINSLDKYASVHVKRGDYTQEQIEKIVEKHLQDSEYDIYIGSNYISIYHTDLRVESMEKYLVKTSKYFSQPVLGVCAFEDGIFVLALCQYGKIVTKGTWGEIEDKIDFDILCNLLDLNSEKINNITVEKDIHSLADKMQSALGIFF